MPNQIFLDFRASRADTRGRWADIDVLILLQPRTTGAIDHAVVTQVNAFRKREVYESKRAENNTAQYTRMCASTLSLTACDVSRVGMSSRVFLAARIINGESSRDGDGSSFVSKLGASASSRRRHTRRCVERLIKRRSSPSGLFGEEGNDSLRDARVPNKELPFDAVKGDDE